MTRLWMMLLISLGLVVAGCPGTGDDDDSAPADDDDATADDDDATADDDDATADDDDSAFDPCPMFCAGAVALCTGANEQWPDTASCEIDCATWPLGTEGDATGNTLACRGYHLGAAQADADTHCAHVGPNPTEFCID